MILPSSHPRRVELNDEVHARPYQALQAPQRASYLAMLAQPAEREREYAHVAALCSRYGCQPPPPGGSYHAADCGGFRLRWERHGEFSSYTVFEAGTRGGPVGQPGVDALLRELRASVRNRDAAYQARIEGVLGRLTPAYVVPSVAPLLDDASLRVPAARILGRTGQASAVPALKKHLNDRGDDAQLAIAEALVALRCEEGVPVLIGALESDAIEVRVLACDALKRATGLTHDYRIYASPAENGRAIEAWKAWWKEYGPTYRLPDGSRQ